MRFFVTGATGFVGGALVRRLRARGDEVVALVRRPAHARHLADAGVELAAGDVVDRQTLVDPMRDLDGVFHIAGWYKLRDPDRASAWAVNVEDTRNVLVVKPTSTSHGEWSPRPWPSTPTRTGSRPTRATASPAGT